MKRIKNVFGRFMCLIGRHKWRPIEGTLHLDWRSRWEAYEVADGMCQRHHCAKEAEIRRDYYW